MKKNKQAHEFAIYTDQLSRMLSGVKDGADMRIDDAVLVHRIHNVLRIQPEQTIIIFDREQHAQCVFKSASKRSVEVLVHQIKTNTQLSPSITFLLPVLKRDAFETALYAMVELGATVVQPIITQKIHKMWLQEKDMQRMERIMIAAAEQSKNFAFPQLLKPCLLIDAISSLEVEQKIYFDAQGQELFAIAEQLREQKPSSIALMVGPEGDITPDEKKYVQQHGFVLCKLTPTILRASQAATLSLGAFRTLLPI